MAKRGQQYKKAKAALNQDEYDIQIKAVSEVPVPAAVWLFASCLLGLAGVARKKRSTR